MHADPTISTVLTERYRLDAEIGRGGMGVVYRGEHILLGKTVAIKILESQGPEFIRRFQREARLLARIDHPGVCGVSDFGTNETGQCFLVMDYLDGMTLDRLLVRDRRLPERLALRIFRQLAEALAHCHALDVVHRDLKPENIMLLRGPGGEPGAARILDFGIAVSTLPDPDAPRVTRAGVVLGTPAYMSPEQASGGEIDARSDLYALGVMLFECITGRNPFDAGDPRQTMAAHVHTPAPTMAEAAPDLDISSELEVLVARLLVKDRDARLSSAAALAEALARIERGERAALTRATSPAPPGPATRPTRRRRGALLAVGAIAVATALAVAFAGGSDGPGRVGEGGAATNGGGFFVLPPIQAVEDLALVSHVLARAVKDRQPVEPSSVFPDDVGRVYCHLVVHNKSKHKAVFVAWVLEGEERSRTRLRVGTSEAWHTWAVTTIRPNQTGSWRCDVLTPDGERIGSAPFIVEAPATASPR